MLYQQSAISDSAAMTALRPEPDGGMLTMIAAYQRPGPKEAPDLRAQLASILLALTGRAATSGSIWVDRAGRAAVATLDGHTFCLRDQKLTLLRRCAYCGMRSFTSPSIRTVEDLGHALSWEPRCRGCEPDDEDWSYSW